MKYLVPFGINIANHDEATKTIVNKMEEEDHLVEVLKVVSSSIKTGGFLGIGKKEKEKVESIGTIYVSVYAYLYKNYQNRDIGLLFSDDILQKSRQLSLPNIFTQNADTICNGFESASTHQDYISRLESTVDIVKKLEVQKLDSKVILTNKIIKDFDDFLVGSQTTDNANYIVSQTPTSNSEIYSIIDYIRKTHSESENILRKLSIIQSRMMEISNKWENILENERIYQDQQYVDIINKMVDRYNHIFLPQVEADKDRKIAILSERRDDAVHRYDLAYERAHIYANSGNEGALRQAEQTALQLKRSVEQIDSDMRAVISNYEKEIKTEKEKIDEKKYEHNKMDKSYKNKIQKMKELINKFDTEGDKYSADADAKLENTLGELYVPLGRFKNGIDPSQLTQILIPVYIGVYRDNKDGKYRFVVIPPIINDKGKLKVEKDGFGAKIMGKIMQTVGSESFSGLLKDNIEKKLESETEFQKICLQHVSSNSILNPASQGFSKAKSGLQNAFKSGKINDKEYNKIQTIIK